jgi:rod shape-determining protein MreD
MKPALYVALVLALVPVQATLMHYVAIAGVKPDAVFIAVCLVGLLSGMTEGMLVGVILGFIQDIFSAGQWGLNLATKGLVGFLAGLVSRQVTNAAPATLLATLASLSLVSGVIVLFAVGTDIETRAVALPYVLLPEIVLNAAVGTAIYWLLPARAFPDRGRERDPAGWVL